MKVYQNAALVTVNDHFDVFMEGTLAVEGEKIIYAGPKKEFPGAETVDLTGHVILPGFVNGHIHMPMVFFRGYADDMCLQDWLDKRIFPKESNHTEATQYHGAQLATAELTRTGTTTVNDMYCDGFQTGRALKEAGLSGIVSTCLIEVKGDHEEMLDNALRLNEYYQDDPDIRTAIAPHAEYTNSPEFLTRLGDIAVRTGQPIHIHCSETVKEHEECIGRHGLTPVQLFDRLGMTRVPLFLAHCVYVTDEDMDIIRTRGASVLHNPCSNLKLGSGVARIPLMLEKGLKIATSTDGCASNNTLDMWEEMRFSALIHKGVNRDATAVSAKQALYLATRGAAEALGYTDRGALVPGMRADFIVSSLQEPAMQIPTDITNLVVYSGSSRDIVMTVAKGEVLYDHGVYTKLDTAAIYEACRADFRKYFMD